jgi:hypothetical protein
MPASVLPDLYAVLGWLALVVNGGLVVAAVYVTVEETRIRRLLRRAARRRQVGPASTKLPTLLVSRGEFRVDAPVDGS